MSNVYTRAMALSCEAFATSEREVLGKGRSVEACAARMAVAYALREAGGMSFPAISEVVAAARDTEPRGHSKFIDQYHRAAYHVRGKTALGKIIEQIAGETRGGSA